MDLADIGYRARFMIRDRDDKFPHAQLLGARGFGLASLARVLDVAAVATALEQVARGYLRWEGTFASRVVAPRVALEPILAGVRSPRRGRKPTTWTRIDRDYETLRIDMQTLLGDLGISTAAAA